MEGRLGGTSSMAAVDITQAAVTSKAGAVGQRGLGIDGYLEEIIKRLD